MIDKILSILICFLTSTYINRQFKKLTKEYETMKVTTSLGKLEITVKGWDNFKTYNDKGEVTDFTVAQVADIHCLIEDSKSEVEMNQTELDSVHDYVKADITEAREFIDKRLNSFGPSWERFMTMCERKVNADIDNEIAIRAHKLDMLKKKGLSSEE